MGVTDDESHSLGDALVAVAVETAVDSVETVHDVREQL